MLLNQILQQAKTADKEKVWNLDDGTYTGTISEFNLVKEGEYFMIKIVVGDIVFMNIAPVYNYTNDPLRNITDPFEDTDDMIEKQIEFDIKNNTSKQGKVFSNITRVKYI